MHPDNLPVFAMRLVVVKGLAHSQTTARLQLMLSHGDYHTIDRWTFEFGRPTPSQIDDIVASMGNHAATELVSSFGVQGVLRT